MLGVSEEVRDVVTLTLRGKKTTGLHMVNVNQVSLMMSGCYIMKVIRVTHSFYSLCVRHLLSSVILMICDSVDGSRNAALTPTLGELRRTKPARRKTVFTRSLVRGKKNRHA